MKKLSWLFQAGLAFACASTCLAAPKIGVFPQSNDGSGKTKADQWEAWVGRDVDYILQFYAGNTWGHIDGTTAGAGLDWWSNQWVNYPQEYKDKLVIAIPILPTTDVLPAPSGDNLPDDGSSLQTGATGAYNQRWINCATKLVARGMGNATLRLGWEFNGGWYTWNTKQGRIQYFDNYWIHIVNSMRSVPGANFKFCWNPTVGDEGIGDPTVGWPGAAYVDYIGLDIYDTYSGYDTEGYPSALPAWQVTSIRNNAWLSKKEWGNYHLDWWTAKSNTYGVPLCFPEWGLDDPTPESQAGHGGKDNPVFLQKFKAYVESPTRNVAWHAYFDWGGPSDSRRSALFFSTQYPNSRLQFPILFGPKYTDNFEDSVISDWTYSPAAQWSVVTDGGDKAFRFDYNWTNTGGTASAGDNAWTNYKLLVDAKITESNSWSQLYLYARYTDSNNYYRLRMEEQSGGAKRWYLDKRVNGTTTTVGAYVGATFALNTWYTIGLEVNGSTITVTQNGAQIMQRTDTSLTAGRIALGGNKQDINFDNVEVQ